MTLTTAHCGLILFLGDRPGNHATVFGLRGEKLAYYDDMSSFDDGSHAPRRGGR